VAVNALAVAGRLGAASDALAALGALIRIETEGLDADPEVHAALRAIAAELLGDPTVDPVRDSPILGLAQTFLAQGAELLANPGRAGAWNEVDARLLQGIGRMSMSIVGAIQAAAEQTPSWLTGWQVPRGFWMSAPVSVGLRSPWPVSTPACGWSASTSSSRPSNWPGAMWPLST
jgi:hypothetical protein